MKSILKIILTNILIAIFLLFLHEATHAAIGYYMGCNQIKLVLLDFAIGPHTELVCPSNVINGSMYIGSLITTISFGSIFLLLRSNNLFFLALGFSFVFSALDMGILLNSELPFYISASVGLASMIAGEYSIASNYARNQDIPIR